MDKAFAGSLPISTAATAATRSKGDSAASRQICLEQSLRESGELAVNIIDSLLQHIAVLDANGVIVSVNRAWRDFARDNGATGSALGSVGINYLEICTAASAYPFADQAPAVLAGISAVLAGTSAEFNLEYPCSSPAEERWFIVRVTPLRGAFQGAVVAHENITPRKRAEEAILGAQQLMQQFIDHLPGTAFVKDENLRVLLANRAFQNILGIDPATMIGKSNSELFPGDFGKRLEADDRRILSSGQSTTLQEDFEGRFFETSKFVIESETGKRLLGGITLDVTQRYKYSARQDALLRISELGGTLAESEFLEQGLAMIGRLTISPIGFIHFVNGDQHSIELACSTAGAGGRSSLPIDQVGSWADGARDQQIMVFNAPPDQAACRGLPPGLTPLKRLLTAAVIEEGQVRMIVGIGNKTCDYDDYDCVTAQMLGNDIWRIIRRVRAEATLQQKLSELIVLNARLDETNNKLLQSEKLASIGQLAAGVAHEINNPIGYVTSNLNSLAGYLNDLLAIDEAYREIDERFGNAMPQAFERAHRLKNEADYSFIIGDIHHLIDESRQGLDRVGKIVRDLKDFSRVGATGWQLANLHEGLESTLNIVWNEIKYKAKVERDYGELPEINCIPAQINQVLMNLLTNAAQAITAAGRIVLRSRCEGRSVWIEVEDNGIGIAAENLERIFEPFFTTKPIGQGTGLGLSLSWGIVQRHHGKIEVHSTPGHGTTFRVTLPIDPQAPAESDHEAVS
ncbi:MAG: hypothetical protein H6R17_1385 [Proteobacteria bacterium]|nr:hypothetical protein [Pseudomonadota bacterium]